MTPLRIADLFCGAGGTSTGAVQAARNLGHAVELTEEEPVPTEAAPEEDDVPF